MSVKTRRLYPLGRKRSKNQLPTLVQLREQRPRQEARQHPAGALGSLTDCSPDLAEEQSEADESPVPLMVLPNGGHAHEDEDEGLAHAAQHLHEVLDGRV